MFHDVLAAQLVNGLAIGLTYCLVALGYNLTFGVLRIANLAYGEVLMSGAMATLLSRNMWGLNYVAASIFGVFTAAVVGVAIHCVAVAPLGAVEKINSQRHMSVLVSTLGASAIIQYLALAIAGPYPQSFELFSYRAYDLFGISVPLTVLINGLVAIILLVGIVVTLRLSEFGLRLRALTTNRTLAYCSGIRVGREQFRCVALSSMLAGAAGILICQQVGAISPYIGFGYGLKGLVALIIGRSMLGTAVVALAIGISETIVSGFISSSYRDLVVYALMILFVLSRSRASFGDES